MSEGLVAALARAQAKFGPIVKSHTNPAFKSQYADVADVLAAVRPILAAEGIFVSQSTRIGDEGGVVLETTLEHVNEPDNEMRSEFPLYVAGLTAQQVGSLMTYHRRYQLCAILGVHPEGDDDDGNAAQTAPQARQQGETTSTAILPLDWRTRPLATMTFPELRVLAVELGHPFSGGSKAELIRQLEPLVRAASGEEPWPVEGEGGVPSSHDEGRPDDRVVGAPSRPEPNEKPFEPVVANGLSSARASLPGSQRKALDSSMKAEKP